MKMTLVSRQKLSIRLIILLSTAIFFLLVGGCASPPATTGPGTPDATQLQHYEMLETAIELQSRGDALAALALLQADVSRWQTNSVVIMKAFVDQAAVTDAVADEDWGRVTTLVDELTSYYRQP